MADDFEKSYGPEKSFVFSHVYGSSRTFVDETAGREFDDHVEREQRKNLVALFGKIGDFGVNVAAILQSHFKVGEE